jgi:hypothetical protein
MDSDLDPDADLDPSIFVIDLKDAQQKTIFLSFSAYYFLNVHLNHFSKIKRRYKAVRIKVFLTIFAGDPDPYH